MFKLNNNDEKNLFNAVLNIKTEEECKKFFYDLCTPSEMEEFAGSKSGKAFMKEGSRICASAKKIYEIGKVVGHDVEVVIVSRFVRLERWLTK